MFSSFSLAFIVGITSFSALAATTGNLILTGVVPQRLSVTVTPTPVASALDLETSAVDLTVASVNERSNSSTGYTMQISSANLGKLLRSGGTEFVTYTLKYNSSAVALGSPVTISNPGPGNVNVNKSVSISYTGVPHEDRVQGTYTDTVTFTIAAI